MSMSDFAIFNSLKIKYIYYITVLLLHSDIFYRSVCVVVRKERCAIKVPLMLLLNGQVNLCDIHFFCSV